MSANAGRVFNIDARVKHARFKVNEVTSNLLHNVIVPKVKG